MATLHDRIVPLLKLGLKPKIIAKKMRCGESYVRAVKAREFGNGREVERRYEARNRDAKRIWQREYKRQRYWNDPEFRERVRAHEAARYQRRKRAAQSQHAET